MQPNIHGTSALTRLVLLALVGAACQSNGELCV